MIARRCGEAASSVAEESVIEAPKPSIRWKVWRGSTVIVGAPATGGARAERGCWASRSALSPVVIHARGSCAAAAGGKAAARARRKGTRRRMGIRFPRAARSTPACQ